jgi:hypothetical protein
MASVKPGEVTLITRALYLRSRSIRSSPYPSLDWVAVSKPLHKKKITTPGCAGLQGSHQNKMITAAHFQVF